MQTLSVLSVIDQFHPLVGGAETVALETARALVKRGHSVTVLTMRKQEDWREEESLDGIGVRRYHEARPCRPFGPLLYELANARRTRKAVTQLCGERHFDAMLLHPLVSAWGAVASGAAAKLMKIGFFYAPFHLELRKEMAQRTSVPLSWRLWAWLTGLERKWYQRRILRRCDRIVALSRYSQRLLGEFTPSVQERSVVMPAGVDANRFAPAADREQVREELGFRSDSVVLLTVRRLVPRMGLIELVQAMPGVLKEHPNAALAIAGSGPLAEALRRLVESLSLRDTVRLLGFVPDDDLSKHYQAADVFVMPSTDLEAFGLTTLEALACGTPVLGSQQGGTIEILEGLGQEFFLKGTAPESMAQSVSDFLSTALPQPGLRDRCRRYVLEHFSWEQMAERLEELCEA